MLILIDYIQLCMEMYILEYVLAYEFHCVLRMH